MNTALSIAGSDSGGGAGIQADLKTFSSLGVYGATALTAVTAQNTVAVTAFDLVSTDLVTAQITAVLDDIGAHAIKTGMLGSADIIRAVAQCLENYTDPPLVVDPVMVSKSGAHLLPKEAAEMLKNVLLPRALIVTPNIPEAEVLTGVSISCTDDMLHAASRLLATGVTYVVVKGGHLEGDATDLVYSKDEHLFLRSARIMSHCTHGTGCTFSAAITAYLARGLSPINAIQCAKTYITQAILSARQIGSGHAPTNHFWNTQKFSQS